MKLQHFILAFLLSISFSSYCQTTADSLYGVWQDEQASDSSRVLAFDRYINEIVLVASPDSAMLLSQTLRAFSKSKNFKTGEAIGLFNIAWIHLIKGSYGEALDVTTQTLKLSDSIGYKSLNTQCLTLLGLIYSDVGEFEKANYYFMLCMERVGNDVDNPLKVGILVNTSYNLEHWGRYNEALEYGLRALNLLQSADENQSNWNRYVVVYEILGSIYFGLKDYEKAKEFLNKALGHSVQVTAHRARAYSLSLLGKVMIAQGEYERAIEHCSRALIIAQKIRILPEQKMACECMYDANKSLNNSLEALRYIELLQQVNDSINAKGTVNKLQIREFTGKVLADSLRNEQEKLIIKQGHDEELRAKEKTRNIAIGSGILALLLAIGFFSRYRFINKTKTIIEIEKERSDDLLLNILPADIAEELKIHGKAQARDFDMVSILFTDFKGFTAASAKLSASDLVNEINTCFESFDTIMEKYGIEKIKTIGDAYMAAGGLPVPSDDSIKNTILAALEMQDFIGKRKAAMDATDKPAFEMRVGIHTGPVVAGIVGVKKFQYDIWGDAVNTASRMESSGHVGKVNISQVTYELIKDDPQFTFKHRGKVEAKGKGEVDMWFVSLAR